MTLIKPFRGMRPIPEKITEVASPPWDVISTEEARERAKDNPYSFLHISRPEIDLEPSIYAYDRKVYAKGAENLKRFIEQGIFIQDEKPYFYIYKLRMGTHVQIGLVAIASVEEYVRSKIKEHEQTLPHKVSDRANHIDSLNAQTGLVFLTYHANKKINDLIQKGIKEKPVYDFIGDYQVQHTFYIVDNETLIKKFEMAFLELDALYIADGHHRTAASARVCEKRKAANKKHTGNEAYNYFLGAIFPDSQMQILEYNRVVKDLNGQSLKTFLERIAEKFEITHCKSNCKKQEDKAYRPSKPHTFGMYLQSQWYFLNAKKDILSYTNPIEQLDISILQNNLLAPILGIEDPRTDDRIDFIGGIRGTRELEKLVNEGQYTVAFSLYPPSMNQFMAVADSGEMMPPKSTWFEPKLRSGIVIHTLDETNGY